MLVLPLTVTSEFVCTSPPEPGYAVAWGVNGTSAVHSRFQDYIVLGEEFHLVNGGIQRNLTFTADARANNTHIRCAVTNINNGQFIVLVDLKLTLQGKLVIELINYAVNVTSPLRSSTSSYCDKRSVQ